MEKILTRNGIKYIVLIDNDDIYKLYGYGMGIKLDKSGNVKCVIIVKRNQKTQSLHRFLLDLTDMKLQVDHINRNPLDNRKANLRICTVTDNSRNKTSHKGSSSPYLGVSCSKISGKYIAAIRGNSKSICLGIFDDEIIAARRYDAAANYYFGEFANLNFPDSVDRYIPEITMINETLSNPNLQNRFFKLNEVRDMLVELFKNHYIPHYIKNKIRTRLIQLCNENKAVRIKEHYKIEKFKLL